MEPTKRGGASLKNQITGQNHRKRVKLCLENIWGGGF